MPLAYLLTYLTISSLLFLAHFVEKFSVLLLLLKFFFDSLWFTEEFLLSSHHYECFGALNNFLSETFRLQCWCWCLLYYRASWLAVVARDVSWRFSFFNWNHLKKKSFFLLTQTDLLQMLIVLVDWHTNQLWRIYLIPQNSTHTRNYYDQRHCG